VEQPIHELKKKRIPSITKITIPENGELGVGIQSEILTLSEKNFAGTPHIDD
jgi:hypothetical protein